MEKEREDGFGERERGYDTNESGWVGPLAPCLPVSGK